MKQFRLMTFVLCFGFLFAACHASVSTPAVTGPTPIGPGPDNKKPAQPAGAPTDPQPFPDKCADYTGSYQVNSDNFQIKQTACSQVDWITLPTFNDPSTYTTAYIPDGVARTYDKVNISTYFTNDPIPGTLTQQYKNANGRLIVQRFSFQTAPCNLANPDGQTYLTKEVWIEGDWSFDDCKFWARQPNP